LVEIANVLIKTKAIYRISIFLFNLTKPFDTLSPYDNMKGEVVTHDVITTYLKQGKIGWKQSYENLAVFPFL